MNKKSEQKGEILFGIHPVIEVLKAKRRPVIRLYTTQPTPKAWKQVEELLPKGVPIQYVPRESLTKLAGTTDHQGIVIIAAPFPIQKQFFNPQRHPILIMLDGVQDPRNLGAILRSAHCTGVTGVIITKKGGAPLNGVAIKSAAGLSEHLAIYESPSAAAAVIELKKAGYTIYLAALGGKSVLNTTFSEPLCLVIGSEGTGISPDIRSAGHLIMLPQKTPSISYNASVAAGILLFLVTTQTKRLS